MSRAASKPAFYRPTWAEVSRSAFAANIQSLRSAAGGAALLAVLKADAYGHGAAFLAPVAIESGAAMIGVSSIEEGVSLRQSGVRAPILILGSIFPLDNFALAAEWHLTPTVASVEAAQALSRAGAAVGRVLGFHLKVDTGMGRIGLSPAGVKAFLARLPQISDVRLEGVYTHFASADSDDIFTARQASDFSVVLKEIHAAGHASIVAHAANSSALLAHPDFCFDMVRPGIALYGVAPVSSTLPLRPVLSWKSRVVFIKKIAKGMSVSYGRTFVAARETDVATLPVGYADGIPRAASGKASVLVRGRRCAVLGRVTMDQVMVDVTGIGADVGDEVVLIGAQGDETVTAADWAAWAGTIPYEILCGISRRVPRVEAV